jgi:glutathione S-transferase
MSSKSKVPVVLYGYERSPYTAKIRHILTLKDIPHHKVEVSDILPRPELSELLGVTYRRIPILAIGNDVYCDTSLISYVLERRFPTSVGYGTIFPRRKNGKADTGMIKAFAQNYPERALFPLAAALLPWQKFQPSFVKDRSDFNGVHISPEAMVARQPRAESILSSNLALLEEQLLDDREWLFDTELPSLADISVYFVYAWIQLFWKKELFDARKFPKSVQWISRVTEFLKQKKAGGSAATSEMSGDQAAGLIGSSTYEPYNVVGFDEIEAKRLGVLARQLVAIAPDDSGRKHPTVGKLVALNREEFVLETKGSTGSVIRCHFPRLGFSIRASNLQTKL